MSHRSETDYLTIEEIAKRGGRYPPAAYEFVRQGLEHASRAIHGPMSPAQYAIARFLTEEHIDLDELRERYHRGELDASIDAAIEQVGGFDRLNRNISGTDLCWSLRDLALEKWSVLAPLVLDHWGISRTDDFGAIVFDLVDHGHLQKEERDSRDDFVNVFDFASSFETLTPVRKRD